MANIKYLFIINPIAGDNDKKPFLDFIASENKKSPFKHIIYKTTGEDDELEIKKIINENTIDTAVAVGGDGTLIMAARLFINSPTHIGLVPAGSANGMSKELQIPRETDPVIPLFNPSRFKEAWNRIRNGQIKELDMIRINKNHYSMHLSDIGLNAKIVKRFEDEKNRGYLGYARQFFKELKLRRKISYQIEADGINYSGRGFMIVIANAQMYGSGSVINPSGSYDDGQFELCIVKRIHFYGLLKALLSIFKKDVQYQKQDLKVITCTSAVIKLKQKEILQIDGEVIGEVKKIKAEIIPKCVKMLV